MRETFTALHPVCFCLQRVGASAGRDQTFTKNKSTRGLERKTAVVAS